MFFHFVLALLAIWFIFFMVFFQYHLTYSIFMLQVGERVISAFKGYKESESALPHMDLQIQRIPLIPATSEMIFLEYLSPVLFRLYSNSWPVFLLPLLVKLK